MLEENSNAHDRRHQQIAWVLLTLLLLLRIPYTIYIIYFLPIENKTGGSVYEITTYAVLAFLIWWEQHRLSLFHIDVAALIIFVLFRPLQTLILNFWKVDSPLTFPRLPALALWAISIGLVTALIRSGYKPARFTRHSSEWLVVGLFAGVFISIGENLKTVISMLSNTQTFQLSLQPILFSTSINLVYHLGFAPINEEPLFRGFLWGYLRQRRWREGFILLFQMVLFTIAHVYFAFRFPLLFWAFIPSAALVFGLLTWRARSIAPAMLAHGLINGSIYLLVYILFRLFS